MIANGWIFLLLNTANFNNPMIKTKNKKLAEPIH